MKTVESFSVLESFGLVSEGKGLFSEVSEIDMTDVVGGNCGGGLLCGYFCVDYPRPSLPDSRFLK